MASNKNLDERLIGSLNLNLYTGLLDNNAKKRSYARSSSNSSKISTRHLQLIIDKLVGQSQRSSTSKNYLAIWR